MTESLRRIELEYHQGMHAIAGNQSGFTSKNVAVDEKLIMHAGEILRTLGAETAAAYLTNAIGGQHAEHEA